MLIRILHENCDVWTRKKGTENRCQMKQNLITTNFTRKIITAAEV